MHSKHCGWVIAGFGLLLVILLIIWVGYRELVAGGTVKGILTDEPCAPPCWQGITPGMVVEKHTLLRKVRRLPGTSHTEAIGNSIRWFWRDWPGYNLIYIRENSDVVHNISLTVDFDLTVNEILTKYDTPKSIVVVGPTIPEVAYSNAILHYPVQGFYCVVGVYPDYNPVLKPSSTVYEVTYFEPYDSYEAWIADYEGLTPQPWPGYGELEIQAP